MTLPDPSQPLPKRIFIDATYTLASGKSSGIERVVRSVTRECQRMAKQGQIPDVRQVISHGGRFYEVGPAEIDRYRNTAAMHRNVLSCASPVYRRAAKALCSTLPLPKLRKWFLPQPGHLGVFKVAHSIREAWVHRQVARTCTPVSPTSQDIFLLPDAYWVNRLRNTIWPAATHARHCGAKVASVMYDLIPITHPEFVGRERSEAFLEYVKSVASHSDMVVAISQTVREQVDQLLAELPQPPSGYCRDIRSFDLGCELKPTQGEVRPQVSQAFAGVPPYLMVATFDPRKNHEFLLDAFDEMWQTGDSFRLCLVGRFGAQCDRTVARIQQHPQLGEKLLLFNDLSDAELQYCYRHARAVIFPSIVEGFGLPIVESLWFGKKTFASDTQIHREVGQSDCSYFSLDSTSQLIDSIRNWEQQTTPEEVSGSGRQLTTWRESANQIVHHCLSLFADRVATNPSSADTICFPADREAA
ncbi:MAG: glycosyltransferase family 4 protein [Planctomycetales bacterium]|nr:glycosyltransferase family 4 protein [Planctomycetales bacterium]